MLSGIELWLLGRTAYSLVTKLTELPSSLRSYVNTGSSIKFRTPKKKQKNKKTVDLIVAPFIFVESLQFINQITLGVRRTTHT